MLQIDSLLKKVMKPGRYTGGELNSIVKDHQQVKTTFAFAFPDLYEIGMSYLGLQILYGAVNDCPDLLCERVFAPDTDMETLMRENNIPLFSIESRKPVRDFDVFGFTLQYEMSYTNILNMLDLAGIPLRWEDRTEEDPLVVAGGPCAFNPEPLADFFDLFMIGDGEELLPTILRMRSEYPSKKEYLKAVSQLTGVYVPCLYDITYNEDHTIKAMTPLEGAPAQVDKAMLPDLEAIKFPDKPLVPLIEVVQDRAVVEIFRGCSRGCRFCQAGMIYRPVRERKTDTILDLANRILDATGYDEMTLLSLSTSDYSDFERMTMGLLTDCAARNVALSLPSLRLDSFSFKVLNEIQKYRKSGLTFAPEAGTQRLRDIINKNITEEDIYSAVRQAIDLGWKHIKFYFMMGLPGETLEDLDGIANIARRVMEINREMNVQNAGRFNVTVSVSNFVPKAHTPFQWEAQEENFKEKHDYLTKQMKPLRGVTFNYHDDPVSRLEGVFARGDRRTGYFLEAAWRHGCRFDAWSERYNQAGWDAAEADFQAKYGYGTNFYRVRKRSRQEILPWDFIDSGVTRAFYEEEADKAMAGETTPDCRLGCNVCGLQRWTNCALGGIYA